MASPRPPGYTTPFPSNFTEPWAQVTMLDADQGDCHVIDLCVVKPQPDNSYPVTGNPSYKRVIVDTGPKTDACLANLINVLKTYGQPTLQIAGGGGLSWPEFWDEAFVEIFELTHVDQDHCGNAVNLMEAIVNDATLRKSFKNTEVLYHEFPLMTPDLVFHLTPRPDASGAANLVVAMEKYPGQDWILQHQNAGFRLVYNFKVQPMLKFSDPLPLWGDTAWSEWKSEDNNAQIDLYQSDCWEPSTGNRFGAACVACCLTIERQRKVGNTTKRAGNATAFVEIEMGNAMVREEFLVRKAYILQFNNPADPSERARFKDPIPITAPPKPPLVTIRDFYLIRSALAELEAMAVKAKVTRPLITAPRDWAIQGAHWDWNGTQHRMHVVGPLKGIYHDLIGDSMSAFYESADIMKESLDPGNYDIANRASIVTLFARTSDLFPGRVFKMLFTGDAYDRDCNVAGTVQAFAGLQQPIMVDVLKVPHHGSDVTADAEFYRLIRAQIYLISGKQTRNGSPALKTLKAIASGFRQDPGSWDPAASPAFLFFSDATTLDNVVGQPSNSAQLLSSEMKPNRANNGAPVYNYYCFRLKRGRTKDRTAGRILFGAGKGGECRVAFGVASGNGDADVSHEWVQMG